MSSGQLRFHSGMNEINLLNSVVLTMSTVVEVDETSVNMHNVTQCKNPGSNGLVSQLKKSYSLNDLSEEQTAGRSKESADVIDNSYYEDPRLIRRNTVQSPRQTMPPAGINFPEVDVSQRLGEEGYYRQISSEEINPGYSSGGPLFYNMQDSKGDHLFRTASLGPSSRVRTRATTIYGLPKRSSLSEGGSTQSAMEPHKSHKETENLLNFPFSHSAFLPFPLRNFFVPEHQLMFENMTQYQRLTFMNHSHYPQFPANENVESKSSSGGVLEIKNESSDNLSMVVLGDISEKPKNQTKISVESIKLKNEVEEGKILIEQTDKNAEKSETVEKNPGEDVAGKKESLEKVAQLSESSEAKVRSGKYNKKPAPKPPVEESKITDTSLIVEEEEKEADFHTPNASPKSEKKHNSNVILCISHESEGKPHDSNFLEVPTKSNSKSKKKDLKLHMPKMSFSFWHQKNGKHSSASESSSAASVETASIQLENKNEIEYFVPLKDSDDNKFVENNRTEEY